ncbi:hypothetical protein, partial [Undibacterium luofuense]|uniref:hypothetical protein n=1 Tax=Undibacterium luofuense TaxID=2828733 RepID=UPI0030EC0F09
RHAALLHEFPAAPLPARAMRQTHLAGIYEMSSKQCLQTKSPGRNCHGLFVQQRLTAKGKLVSGVS